MKAAKIRELSKEELATKLDGLKMDLMKLRFEAAGSQLKNPLKKRGIKRDIARILTILKEKK